MTLTERQQEVLTYIKGFVAQHGYAPSIREIGAHLGIRSPNGVVANIRALVRKGAIRYTQGTARSISVRNDDAITVSKRAIKTLADRARADGCDIVARCLDDLCAGVFQETGHVG